MDTENLALNFVKTSGLNFRIEKNNPKEKSEYRKIAKADKNKNGEVTLDEYLRFLQKQQPEIQITSSDLKFASLLDLAKQNPAKAELTITELRVGLEESMYLTPVFLDVLKKSQDPVLKQIVVRGLGKARAKNEPENREMVGRLSAAVKNKKEHLAVRLYALEALGQNKSPDAIKALKALISLDEKELSEKAQMTLRLMGIQYDALDLFVDQWIGKYLK